MLLCRFGVITDVQYCDIEPAAGWDKYVRRFRGSFTQLADACKWWMNGPSLDFIVQGGDLIDSRCLKNNTVNECLTATMTILSDVSVPLLSMVGNHEMACLSFHDWCNAVGTKCAPEATRAQLLNGFGYSHWRSTGLRVLILNGFQESMLGTNSDTSEARASAESYFELCKARQGFIPGKKTHLMHDCNGGLGEQQIHWLHVELAEAANAGERVIIVCHQPLHPKASEGISVPWDYQKALTVISKQPGVVVAVFAGHYHFGGYHRDENGVHHVTLQSPLLRGAAGCAYGTVEVFETKLVVRGPRLVDLLSGEAFTGSFVAGWNDTPVAKGYFDTKTNCDVWEILIDPLRSPSKLATRASSCGDGSKSKVLLVMCVVAAATVLMIASSSSRSTSKL